MQPQNWSGTLEWKPSGRCGRTRLGLRLPMIWPAANNCEISLNWIMANALIIDV